MEKTSFSLIPLLFLFLGSSSCAQKHNPFDSTKANGKECIEKVINADDTLGTIRNHACEKISLSQTIRNYVSGMEQISFKNCPADFTKAFQGHIKAWNEMIVITDHYPDLRGEMHDLFNQIEKGNDAVDFKKRLKQIWDTWAEVEKFIKY